MLLTLTLGVSSASASSSVSVDKWASSYCTALTQWRSGLQLTVGPDVNLKDPTQAKASLKHYLDSVVTDSSALLARLKSLGPPPVAGGAKILAALRGAFTEAQKAFTATRAALAALAVTNSATFTAGVIRIQGQQRQAFTTIRSMLSSIGTQHPAPALDQAIKNAKACGSGT